MAAAVSPRPAPSPAPASSPPPAMPPTSIVRVWRDAWHRDDGGAWVAVESQPTSAQWTAPPPDHAPELGPAARGALALSGGQPIAVASPDGRVLLYTDEWGQPGVRTLVGAAGPGALSALPDPPLVVVLRHHPPGAMGVQQSIDYVRHAIERDRNKRRLVTWVRQTIHAANLPDARGFPNPDNVVAALFAQQKREMAFVKDPLGGEMMANASDLLCLDPNGLCLRGGDCDDQLIVLGAAVLSAGIPVRLRIRKYRGMSQAHITLEYDSDPRGGGRWTCMDPSTESGACSNAPYTEQIIVDTLTDVAVTGGQFLGLGQLGDPPPPEVYISDEQGQAWTAYVEDVGTLLEQSSARLRNNLDARAALGADLGEPPAVERMADASRLLATADFCLGALGEALVGYRPLELVGDSDLRIGAATGDAFALDLAQADDGAPIPIFAPAGESSSLGAALEIARRCDALASEIVGEARGTLGATPVALPAAGSATPGDVLAYRQTWDAYVTGMARAAATCGAAWQAQVNGTTPSTPPNLSQFAVPPNQSTLQIWATTQTDISDSILSSWNMHANTPDWQLLAQAAAILQDFQNTVERVGSFYAPQIARDCPSLVLPTPPTFDVQSQVIGQLEGLGVVAHGVLQLLGIGATGALQSYGAIAQGAANVAAQAGTAASFTVGPVVVVLGVAAALAGAYFLAKASGFSVGGLRALSASPAMKLYAERIRIDRQGYDRAGRYWGIGAPLYSVSDAEGEIDKYVRAPSAPEAKRKIEAGEGSRADRMTSPHAESKADPLNTGSILGIGAALLGAGVVAYLATKKSTASTSSPATSAVTQLTVSAGTAGALTVPAALQVNLPPGNTWTALSFVDASGAVAPHLWPVAGTTAPVQFTPSGSGELSAAWTDASGSPQGASYTISSGSAPAVAPSGPPSFTLTAGHNYGFSGQLSTIGTIADQASLLSALGAAGWASVQIVYFGPTNPVAPVSLALPFQVPPPYSTAFVASGTWTGANGAALAPGLVAVDLSIPALAAA